MTCYRVVYRREGWAQRVQRHYRSRRGLSNFLGKLFGEMYPELASFTYISVDWAPDHPGSGRYHVWQSLSGWEQYR